MSNTDFDITQAPGVDVTGVTEHVLPQPKSFGEMAALPAGTQFLDPKGQKRIRPEKLTITKDQYADLPEGAEFVAADDPQQLVRKKPAAEGLGFTAQTLYDMAITPQEKRKALEREYPGKVKEDKDGLYVDDNGKIYRPGRGVSSVTGEAAALAGPIGGTILGAYGAGTPGAVGGALLGQGFNDLVLQLSGVYDRSIPEEAGNLALSGMAAMTGYGVGSGLGMLAPGAKAAIQRGAAGFPAAAANFLGLKPDTIGQAAKLAEKGAYVPPSAYAHESPHLQNIAEIFYPAFHTDNPMRQRNVDYYEKQAAAILDKFGVARSEPLLEPKTSVPTQHVGERILRRVRSESREADDKLKAELEKRAATLREKLPETEAQREALVRTADESRKAAQGLIDQGFRQIESDTEAAFKVAQAGGHTGDLWEHIGNKMIALRRAIGERARYWYGRYDQMTGGAKVSSAKLSASAQRMLDELPAEFKSRNPALVQRLAKLAAQYDENGQLTKEAEQLTYGQLHDLRSLFRGSADWHTLSSDFKNGALKHFSNEIDRLIHDPNAPENVRGAAKFLDMVDKWYGHNIKVFEAQQIKTLMRGLEAGEPADAANLYKAIIREGHTDLINRIKKMVGPNLWAGVRAADTQAMLDAAKSLTPGVIDGRAFVREVLDRHRSNLLEVVHGKEASAKLLAQARAIDQLDGRLEIPAQAGDSLTQVIARARLAADEAKAAAANDPLGTLNREMKGVVKEHNRAMQALRAERRAEPLSFLYSPTIGANAAVDRILSSEDLILAAAAKFGENSPEFKLLRQVYAQRLLEGSMQIGKRLEKISPEIQQLMFPGVTLKDVHTLAREMEFLGAEPLTTKTAAGMSAMSKVEHPVGGGIIGRTVGHIPGINPLARAAHGFFYKTITELMAKPATLRWLARGLEKGSPQEKQAIREILKRAMRRGGVIGAGIGETTEQGL